ncbi:DUF4114 domain-containing protein [Scytonema sp. UIC 10036]|uniref:DUF4114 domain-containing protein n=1 Tax=Scytonema sp. UIC 10036 TaxID=2304196 RepID=UPI0012DA340E|nr:DUF4114 domain-containing protein [Scytonema sp. UIC 10036]MUG92030.1 DUF4114 domain-containing protein [Scytonema sp. UIC 10036]
MATTSLNVTVDWNAVEGQTKNEHFGINVYRAVADAGNSKYRSNMNHMSPGIIRFHNMDYMKDSSKDHGLIDTENKTWDAQKVINTIQASIDMFGTDQPQRMFNIPSWPSWMDANNDGYLDSDRFDEYANLCADLVKIVNKDNKFGVQYWEITNEKDIEYFSIFHTKSGWGKLIDPNQPNRLDELITIYNKVAEAMKAVDPSIKVGGPSVARPDLTPFYEPFIKGTLHNLDFFTYHYYPTGSASTSDEQVFNATNSIGKYTKSIVDTLKKLSPDREIPAMLGEYNISWTWETHDPRMTNNKGAVFDALSIIEAIDNGAAASLSWNEKDGSYGKTSYNDTLRPGGQLLHLFNEYLVGNRISTSSNNSNITTFAVDRPGSHKAYVLINSSNSAQEVAVTFNNWNSTQSNVSKHIISDAGYSQELTAWDTVNNSTIFLPANSVIFFEDGSLDVSLPPTNEPNPTPPSDSQGNTGGSDVSLPPTNEPNLTPPSDRQGNTGGSDVGLPPTNEPNPTPPSVPQVSSSISSPENISAGGIPSSYTSTLHQQSSPGNLSSYNQPDRFDNMEFSSKPKDSSTNIASLLLSSGKSVSQSLKSALDTPRNISGSHVTDKTAIGEPEIAAVLNPSNDSQAPLLDLRKTDLNKDGQVDNKVFVNFYDVKSHAVYNNTVGFYKIANIDGAVFDSLTGKLIPPGEKGYAQVALEQRVLEVELNRNTGQLMTQLEGGALYAPYLIASGTAQEYLSNISGNPTSNQTPQAFFGYGVGNPDNINHVKLLGKNQLGFEDTAGGGDRDFNDLMFKVKVQNS